MTNDSYKAWIDAMPIDDVRARIERLERKLADLHVLERLHADRHGNGNGNGNGGSEPAAPGASEGTPEGGSPGESEGAPEGGGGWTHGEGAPEHG